jgi:hypothetical protein
MLREIARLAVVLVELVVAVGMRTIVAIFVALTTGDFGGS